MNDRDLIAIAMLPPIYTDYFAHCRASGTGPQDEHWREEIALEAYNMADAMIAMRSAKVSTGQPDSASAMSLRSSSA